MKYETVHAVRKREEAMRQADGLVASTSQAEGGEHDESVLEHQDERRDESD